MGVVVEEEVPSGTSLDALVASSIQILNSSFDSFDVVDQQAITLSSGQDAKIVDAQIRDASFSDFVIHGKYCFTLANQRGYMAQTYVLEQNYPSVKQALTAIVESLTIE